MSDSGTITDLLMRLATGGTVVPASLLLEAPTRPPPSSPLPLPLPPPPTTKRKEPRSDEEYKIQTRRKRRAEEPPELLQIRSVTFTVEQDEELIKLVPQFITNTMAKHNATRNINWAQFHRAARQSPLLQEFSKDALRNRYHVLHRKGVCSLSLSLSVVCIYALTVN